ncbi:MAG TPA: bifunctional 23S rRNA (guanine(2069)-N(7))-methyltransferase RlmK/23S rRNA (guanine(2445)-N(2))-methyltransferase RlmL [Pirellulales bacterium]|nr:bifunctional 23S rRNA (guanine(2069)-N(7))-methyltransferase RlmK/23S rRNA (guanine(2445)-N(2))-methyltransferase RlmL [Pirellulales bacterium]
MSTVTTFPTIAKTFFGLEAVLAQELAELGATEVSIGRRMVSFTAEQELLYRANLWCRTAVRILKPIGQFKLDPQAADPYRSLYARLQEIEWGQFLLPTGTLAIDPVVHGRLLTNSLYAAQVAKDAVVDWFRERHGVRPNVERIAPDLRINLHVAGEQGTVYLDASGSSLHKRGYRRITGEAPLNEVLAAGILRLSAWDGAAPLVDFLCGSGTLPIEAALMARNIAPGLFRDDFGYRRWLDFDAALEARVLDEARQAVRPEIPSGESRILGSDLDPAVVAAARENAARAGVAADILWQQANFEQLEPPTARGTIVINPPYDERLRVAGVGAFYRRLGNALSRRWQGFEAWVLAGNLPAIADFGIKPAASIPLRNGPIECRLLRFKLSPSQGLPHASPAEPTVTSPQSAPRSSAVRSSPVEALRSRLARMAKHWDRWARRQGIGCYRVYDCDLPEVPWTIDRYEDRLHVVEHESPHGRSSLEHREWFDALAEVVGQVLEVPPERRHAHRSDRIPAGGTKQHGAAKRNERFVVSERDCRIEVDLGRRDDTGLAPDLRTLRAHLAGEAAGKRFLNLFGHGGAATVAAAMSSDRTGVTVTLEVSGGFVRWSEHNFELNDLRQPNHLVLEADPLEWIERSAAAGGTPFDLALVAPPAGFHRRTDRRAWNPRDAYRQLLEGIHQLLAPRGKIYLVSTVRRFRLDPADVPWATIRDVTAGLLPADCRTKPSLRCWTLVRVD